MRNLGRCFVRPAAVLLAGLVLAPAPPALGAVIITVAQAGGDVVFSGSGTLNLTALTPKGSGNLLAGIDFGREVLIGAGPGSFAAVDFYGDTGQIAAPGPFGSDLFTQASLGSGARMGVAVEAFAGQNGPAIVVPHGYVSGGALSGSSTFTGKTLASLGITPGTYVWTWGSGGNADSLTLTIVPEPSVFACLLAAATGIGALRRRFRGSL